MKFCPDRVQQFFSPFPRLTHFSRCALLPPGPCIKMPNPVATFTTSMGTFTAEIYADKMPVTAGLQYTATHI